jgi:hypothetical protein
VRHGPRRVSPGLALPRPHHTEACADHRLNNLRGGHESIARAHLFVRCGREHRRCHLAQLLRRQFGQRTLGWVRDGGVRLSSEVDENGAGQRDRRFHRQYTAAHEGIVASGSAQAALAAGDARDRYREADTCKVSVSVSE